MLDIGFGEILVSLRPRCSSSVRRSCPVRRRPGPDLPHAAPMVTNARRDLTDSLGPEFDGINLEDLNPRTFVRKQLLRRGRR